MGIKKQEFYEGAALHILASNGRINIKHEPPFYIFDDTILIFLKYSTRKRSPWGFTFKPHEQDILSEKAAIGDLVIGLICGADGIAAISYSDYNSIATPRETALHIACYRQHGHHYKVSGPDGVLRNKVPPSNWKKILSTR